MRRFQSYFGLTSDGVVGRTTWNKLYEVYNDIADRLLTASLRLVSIRAFCAGAAPERQCGSCSSTST